MGRKKEKFKIPGISFSWKRLIGITQAKTKLSRKIGIPLTKQGLQRKIGSALPIIFVIAIIFFIISTILSLI